MNSALLSAIMRRDLIAFLHKAVPTASGEQLRLLPHIECISAYLMQLHRGDTLRLIINQPPRTMKSVLTACFLAWTLGHAPRTKIAWITHAEALAKEQLARVRRIVESEWYREVFPQADCSVVRSTQESIELAGLGGLTALSMSSGITGFGYDLIVIDDPLDAKKASKPDQRAQVIDIYNTAIENRLESKRTGKVIVIMQRLHGEDLCGYLLATGGWSHCSVPLIADQLISHAVGDFRWERAAGDNLDPEKYPDAWVEEQRRTNNAAFLAQYQQRPDLVQGGLIKREWLQIYTALPSGCRTIISIDLAQSLRENASKSAFVVFAVGPGGRHYHLIDVVRRQAEFTTLLDLARDLINRHRPEAILIENASLGPALIAILRQEGAPVRQVEKPSLSKLERLQSHLDVFVEGRLLVPAYSPFTETYVDELVKFPTGLDDDQVDCTSQFLNWIKDPNNTTAPKHIASNPLGRSLRHVHPMRNPAAPRFRGRVR